MLAAGALTVLLSAVAMPAQASSTTEFAASSISLMANAKGNLFGSVTPGTPLTIVTQANGLAEVRIDGWSMVGAESIVFAGKGQRIVLAQLTSVRPANRTIIAHSNDEYGNAWEQVTVTGWVSSWGLVAEVAPVWQKAHALFAKRCATCHALHHPTEFTANQWPHILQIMTKRAVLTAEQTELVTKYLQTHARQPGAPPAAEAAGPKSAGPRR